MRSSLGTPSRPLSRVALCALAWTAVATIAAAPIVVATIAVGAGEAAASSGSSPGSMARGAYLFRIAGCDSCHTDHRQGGPVGAGGPALETRFGLFYGPNLTPDLEHGIGRWHEADFVRAMRSGRAPDGHTYAPVFPYTSFTRLTDDDLIALVRTAHDDGLGGARNNHDANFMTFHRFTNFRKLTMSDSVTAVDIGALPDRSVSEALQRIPGSDPCVRHVSRTQPRRLRKCKRKACRHRRRGGCRWP